jgi:hypothetical protein
VYWETEAMRKISLYFEVGELVETQFSDGVTAEPRISVRGKTGGAFRSAGSFQWTSAVKALALLAATTATGELQAILRGEANSLAASLDYAISKQPQWLAEMFGCDHNGICFARRLILRTNPERKRPGPVTLAINLSYLPWDCLHIYIDGRRATPEQLLELCAKLEGVQWDPSQTQTEDAARIAS